MRLLALDRLDRDRDLVAVRALEGLAQAPLFLGAQVRLDAAEERQVLGLDRPLVVREQAADGVFLRLRGRGGRGRRAAPGVPPPPSSLPCRDAVPDPHERAPSPEDAGMGASGMPESKAVANEHFARIRAPSGPGVGPNTGHGSLDRALEWRPPHPLPGGLDAAHLSPPLRHERLGQRGCSARPTRGALGAPADASQAVIDLSSNENPYGPSPLALEAMTRTQVGRLPLPGRLRGARGRGDRGAPRDRARARRARLRVERGAAPVRRGLPRAGPHGRRRRADLRGGAALREGHARRGGHACRSPRTSATTSRRWRGPATRAPASSTSATPTTRPARS